LSDAPDTTTQPGDIARLISYAALFALSARLFAEAWAVPTSRFEVLGAGAFPMMVHGVLMALLAAAIVRSLRSIPRTAYAAFPAIAARWVAARRLVFVTFVFLAVYLAAMPVLGYPIATLIFLLALTAALAPKTPVAMGVTVVLALLFSFGLNWLFAEVFNVFLPRGS
jgi:hypothetical protein